MDVEATPTPVPGSAAKSKSRKAGVKEPPKKFNPLACELDVPIDVSFENDTVNSKSLDTGGYEQNIKLLAQLPFAITTSVSRARATLHMVDSLIFF